MKKLIAGGLVCVSLGVAQHRKILAPGMSSKQVQEIQAAVPNVTIVTARGPELAKEIVDADAIIGGISPDLFKTAKNLKWVHISSAGVEKGLFPELVDSDVV